jgi:hypothetical protein
MHPSNEQLQHQLESMKEELRRVNEECRLTKSMLLKEQETTKRLKYRMILLTHDRDPMSIPEDSTLAQQARKGLQMDLEAATESKTHYLSLWQSTSKELAKSSNLNDDLTNACKKAEECAREFQCKYERLKREHSVAMEYLLCLYQRIRDMTTLVSL